MSKIKIRETKWYGYRPDLPDHRDRILASVARPEALPPVVDLRHKMPRVYDQGQLGSCTANAIAAAMQFERMQMGLPAYFPSRLFIYYNERTMEGTVKTDAGAEIRDGIKSVAKQGVCDEKLWPYLIKKFAYRPTVAAYAAAKKDLAVAYARVPQTLQAMKSCLAAGHPFVIGFTCYDSFESSAVSKSGILNLPGPSEGVVGGHAVLVVGYDTASARFIVRNSWGAGWGLHGHFTVPFDYFTNNNLADDLWNITAESA